MDAVKPLVASRSRGPSLPGATPLSNLELRKSYDQHQAVSPQFMNLDICHRDHLIRRLTLSTEYVLVGPLWQFELTEQVPTAELRAVGSTLLENFAYYLNYSSRKTQLAWIRVKADGKPIALVPAVRLLKRPATDMLRHGWRRWLCRNQPGDRR